MVTFTHAIISESDECYKILDEGRKFQKAQGFTQWTDAYPNRETVKIDVEESVGYAIKVDGKIAGYCCLRFDGEPAYKDIDGKWSYNEPYAVVHRLAFSPAFRGIGLSGETWRLIGEFCLLNKVDYIRVDTGLENKIMQHVLEKNGFKKCGTICYYGADTGIRYAYDKKL